MSRQRREIEKVRPTSTIPLDSFKPSGYACPSVKASSSSSTPNHHLSPKPFPLLLRLIYIFFIKLVLLRAVTRTRQLGPRLPVLYVTLYFTSFSALKRWSSSSATRFSFVPVPALRIGRYKAPEVQGRVACLERIEGKPGSSWSHDGLVVGLVVCMRLAA